MKGIRLVIVSLATLAVSCGKGNVDSNVYRVTMPEIPSEWELCETKDDGTVVCWTKDSDISGNDQWDCEEATRRQALAMIESEPNTGDSSSDEEENETSKSSDSEVNSPVQNDEVHFTTGGEHEVDTCGCGDHDGDDNDNDGDHDGDDNDNDNDNDGDHDDNDNDNDGDHDGDDNDNDGDDDDGDDDDGDDDDGDDDDGDDDDGDDDDGDDDDGKGGASGTVCIQRGFLPEKCDCEFDLEKGEGTCLDHGGK